MEHEHDWIRKAGRWDLKPECECGDVWNGTTKEYEAWAKARNAR